MYFHFFEHSILSFFYYEEINTHTYLEKNKKKHKKTPEIHSYKIMQYFFYPNFPAVKFQDACASLISVPFVTPSEIQLLCQ